MSFCYQSAVSLLLLSAFQQAEAGQPAMVQNCAVQITEHALNRDYSNPSSFEAQSALFFQRLSSEDIDGVLGDAAPGDLVRLDGLFSGPDSRWRLWRPVPLQDDPDALMAERPQAQYLIKPNRTSPYQSLVMVGIPKSGALHWPIFAGRRNVSDNERFFIIQPADPAGCVLQLATIAQGIEGVLN